MPCLLPSLGRASSYRAHGHVGLHYLIVVHHKPYAVLAATVMVYYGLYHATFAAPPFVIFCHWLPRDPGNPLFSRAPLPVLVRPLFLLLALRWVLRMRIIPAAQLTSGLAGAPGGRTHTPSYCVLCTIRASNVHVVGTRRTLTSRDTCLTGGF